MLRPFSFQVWDRLAVEIDVTKYAKRHGSRVRDAQLPTQGFEKPPSSRSIIQLPLRGFHGESTTGKRMKYRYTSTIMIVLVSVLAG